MQFVDDPCAYFGDDSGAAHALSGAELDRMQQEALAYRLEQFLPRLPALAALAEAQGLDAGARIEDAPRLFQPHTIFKSFDPAWLAAGDFAQLTRWLQCFTTAELKPPPEGTRTIDAWLGWLEENCAFDVAHSTGTTGRMSLVGRARRDLHGRFARNRMGIRTWLADRNLSPEMNFHIVWPGAAGGRSAQQKMAEGWRSVGASSRDHFIALFDDDLGADYELYVVRARLARERAQLALPAPSAHVAEKLAEAERRQATYPQHFARMIDRIVAELPGRRAFMMGSPHNLAMLAEAGIERGIGGSFMPGSLQLSVGGLKGRQEPPDFAGTMRRFLGDGRALEGYGATEMNSGYLLCDAGRFHVPPWVILWVLDAAANWQPKPRAGVQEGRGAFLDLAFSSAWGGLVTADHLMVDYGPCRCGRTSPSFDRLIRRLNDDDGDYSWIPADPSAFGAAREVLRAG